MKWLEVKTTLKISAELVATYKACARETHDLRPSDQRDWRLPLREYDAPGRSSATGAAVESKKGPDPVFSESRVRSGESEGLVTALVNPANSSITLACARNLFVGLCYQRYM